MIRFRIGQSWKREAPGPEPKDAFAFELDGVNLLPGANDEPLVRVIGGLVDAVAAMVVDGDRAGQLSLEDVQLEVCFWRKPGHDVEVSIIGLRGEPKRVRPVVMVDLPSLVEATLSCARTFLRDTERHRETQAAALVSLERRVKALGSTVVGELTSREAEPWQAERGAPLGYLLRDADGRTASFSRRARAGLPCLLFEGSVTTPSGSFEGLPFLTMMGLARSATEGSVAGPEAIFGAGLDLCLALRAHNPMLATNPWLEALQVRCSDGLRALRQPVPDTSDAKVSAPRPSAGLPLATSGQVRRVGLQLKWSRPVALGEDGGRLTLGRGGLVVHSAHAAHAFSSRGQTTFRRLSPRGVAANTAESLVATPERMLHFEARGESVTWLRDHDGSTVGPDLHVVGDVLVTTLSVRGVVGFDRLTGRERWRFDPPRTQRSWVSIAGSRVLIATDSGAFYGIDSVQGQVRFTVRSSMPCACPAVPLAKRALVVLNRGEHTPVYVCEALSSGTKVAAGVVAWTRELTLSSPRPPAVTRTRIFLGGHRDGRSTVIAMTTSGQVVWERQVPLEPQTLTVLPYDGGAIVGDARGAAVRLLPDGQTAWVLGSEGDQLVAPVALAISRSVLVVPGPSLRLVDPATGRVLSALETGPRVTDVAVDKKLTVYVLKEPGLLEAWRPATVLAVI